MDFIEGEILYFNKPLTWTSFQLVHKVRYQICRKLNIKKLKVGHAGTLDPLATGVMILGTGKATKQMERMQQQTKEYVATFELGATTASHDLEKPIDQRFDFSHVSCEMVEKALQGFVGTIEQVPPAFSACKIDGQRAYELARKGAEVPLKAKVLVIDEIEMLRCELPLVEARIVCSKGTYIRSIARDLGEVLGCGAHLTALVRTRIGDIRLENCMSLEAFIEKLQLNP
ncbi:MAG: tRNA pseudouridine(55) synthase TruB [Bacteroidales bacterium]|jgi:tRNA pseudouridine55 synthase|nr:tRNA pseudouridine(55) synthase TruB [Bacteroidales bacterium]MDD3166428.1 tRNA pseudouridine(55) synthase TruB [Bacteroidales bacterium]MDD4770812.1 tRNA pseudouridine(55) synthase TruB [Bacteroidales bacterium]HKL91995.1 tRNA pseudouridine(55) synthase TruB [Bacteroidales bacterium]